MATQNLGRVQGGSYFYAQTSATSVAKSSLTPSDILPLVGDTILFSNGDLRKITAVDNTNVTCGAVLSSFKGQKGDSGINSALVQNNAGTSNENTYSQEFINGMVSNPNLLINGDFKVNQRGETNYSCSDRLAYGSFYTVDRWRMVPQADNTPDSVTVTDNGIKINFQTAYTNVGTFFEDKDFKKLEGKTVTVSVKVRSITGGQVQLQIMGSDTAVASKNITSAGIVTLTATMLDTLTNKTGVRFVSYSNNNIEIELDWVKLEFGSVATAFSPRPYAEELKMCYRYYQKIKNESPQYFYGVLGQGYTENTTRARILVNLFADLRIVPTFLTYDGSFAIHTPSGTQGARTIESISIDQYSTNNIQLIAHISSGATALTSGVPCTLRASNSKDAYIAFNAEVY